MIQYKIFEQLNVLLSRPLLKFIDSLIKSFMYPEDYPSNYTAYHLEHSILLELIVLNHKICNLQLISLNDRQYLKYLKQLIHHIYY